MTDETTSLAGEADQSVASETPQTIEDRLGSFDFDDRKPEAAPAGEAKDENQEPGDDLAELVETSEAKPEDDDDPWETLRDNTKVRRSELKKAYRPTWKTEVEQFEARQKEIEGKAQTFTQQEQFVMQAANAAAAIAQRYIPKPPDPALLKQDPFAYMEQEQEYKARIGELQTLQAETARIQQAAAEKQKQAFQEHVTKQQKLLHDARPELKDPVKATKFWEDVKQLGAQIGFSEQEMSQIPDYRFLLLAEDAIKYRKLVAQRAKLAEKAKDAEAKAPPVSTTPARRISTQERQAQGLREQLGRLRKTGSVKDAEAILSKFD